MVNAKVQHVAILGGGTAGWMCAAAFSELFKESALTITLIESEHIGSVGVGEATIPHLRYFNNRLGIDEHEFIRRTHASYKLGIELIDWGQVGESYVHPFGDFGGKVNDQDFLHYWLRARQEGATASLSDFSLPIAACKHNKFNYPSADPSSLLSNFSYAFQLDATAYAKFLREYSEKRGVKRLEGKVAQVHTGVDSGNVTRLELESGEQVTADFFIDCSGFRSLLLGQTLNAKFDDCSQWLPCDRAIAVPSEATTGELKPYTQAKALSAGWKWTIPLQHRTGNGLVYSSNFMGDDEAEALLLSEVAGEPIGPINLLNFKVGRRKQSWVKNCAAVGLSSGFLEPLESTGIYLIQAAIMLLVEHFPSSQDMDRPRQEFNRLMGMEYDRIRDFLILHYHATHRDDSDFWRYCRTMSIPDSLREKIESFRHIGYIDQYQQGLFQLPSWHAVMVGQGIIPEAYHPLADTLSSQELERLLTQRRQGVRQAVGSMPSHRQVLNKHCLAPKGEILWPEAAQSLYSVFS